MSIQWVLIYKTKEFVFGKKLLDENINDGLSHLACACVVGAGEDSEHGV